MEFQSVDTQKHTQTVTGPVRPIPNNRKHYRHRSWTSAAKTQQSQKLSKQTNQAAKTNRSTTSHTVATSLKPLQKVTQITKKEATNQKQFRTVPNVSQHVSNRFNTFQTSSTRFQTCSNISQPVSNTATNLSHNFSNRQPKQINNLSNISKPSQHVSKHFKEVTLTP